MVACLSRCDYYDGIPGIGVAKAINYIANYKTLNRIFHHLKFEQRFCTFANNAEIAKI